MNANAANFAAAPAIPLSAARRQLADILAHRAGTQSRIAELRASLAKLQAIETAETDARAELAAFDAASAGGMATYAASPSGKTAPKIDSAKRAKLVAKLAAATDAATAARSAAVGIAEELRRRQAALLTYPTPIAQSIAAIVAEQLDGGLIDDFLEAHAIAAAKAARIEAVKRALVTISGTVDDAEGKRPILAIFESVANKIRSLSTMRHGADSETAFGEIIDLARALQSDATATL